VIHETRLEIAPGESRELEVSLERGSTITGRVVDGSGAPVAGASIFTVAPEDLGRPISRRSGGLMYTGVDGMLYEEAILRTWADEARADESGRFALSGVATGPARLRVEHPDFLFRDLAPLDVLDGQDVSLGDIVLERGSTIEGRLFDADGLPARAGSVGVKRLPDEGGDEAAGPEVLTFTHVEGDGSFRERGLRSGRYRLWVAGRAGVERVVDLAADERRHVDLRLSSE